MSELLPERLPFHPSGWSDTFSAPVLALLDDMELQGTLPPMLAAQEVETLRPGEPVADSVAMAYFQTAEGFLREAKNFEVHFRTPASDADYTSAIYRRKEAFQRFEYLYPEIVTALAEHLERNKGRTAQNYDATTRGLLFHAYNIMSGLVSKSDVGIRDDRGSINKQFLLG